MNGPKFDNVPDMMRVQRQIELVCNRATDVEAGVVAFALVRVARELVEKYPPGEVREQLVNTIVAFMRYAEVTGGDPRNNIVTIN